MAEFDWKSRIYRNGFVFYERLLTDNNPANRLLGYKAKTALDRIANNKTSIKKGNISVLYNMAKAEREKEIRVLDKAFGVKIHFDEKIEAKSFYRQLIEGFNYALGLKDVYERSLRRLKEEETHISVARFYPGYFNDEWKRTQNELVEKIEGIVAKNNAYINKTKLKQIDKAIDEYVDDVHQRAMRRMFLSAAEKGEDPFGYTELVDKINEFKQGGSFSKNLYETYGLDKLKDSLKESIGKRKVAYEKLKISGGKGKKKNPGVSKILDVAEGSLGGITLEYIENLIVNTIVSAKNENISIEALHSGQSSMKADNIITINIDTDLVQEAIEQSDTLKTERKNNIKAIEELTEKLKNINDENSFIIYSNAKNYALIKGDSKGAFSTHGFSSGSDISLNTLREVLNKENVQPKAHEFLGAIANTIDETLGVENKPILEEMLASDIAYFLFDDVHTFGEQTSGVPAIHIFDLDGFYIPLSFLLFSLAKAMEDTTKDPTMVVQAYIKTNGIKIFDEGEDRGYERWVEQRKIAWNNITVGAKFFRNFREIMLSTLTDLDFKS